MILDWLKARALPFILAGYLAIGAYAGIVRWQLSTCEDGFSALKATVQTLTGAAEAAKARAAAAVAANETRLAEATARAKSAEQALVDRVHKDESCEDGVAAALRQWRSRP